MRRAGVPAAADRHLPAKRSPKGLGQGQMTEAFVLLSALGGECLDDLEHLRGDQGLAALTGDTLPAASTARQWLDRFHEPALLADRPAQGAFMPLESAALAGLRAVLTTAVRAFVATVPVSGEVTLDVDAHPVESSKVTALPTYEGFRGYQPALVSWAETGLVVADQFRDGNVPAGSGLAARVDEAYAALPSDRAWQVSVRSGSRRLDLTVPPTASAMSSKLWSPTLIDAPHGRAFERSIVLVRAGKTDETHDMVGLSQQDSDRPRESRLVEVHQVASRICWKSADGSGPSADVARRVRDSVVGASRERTGSRSGIPSG